MWGQSPLAIVLTYRLNHPAISDLSRSLNCSQTVCRSHLSPTLPPLPDRMPDCVLTSCALSDRYRRANTAAAALVAATAIAAATAIVVAVRRRRRC